MAMGHGAGRAIRMSVDRKKPSRPLWVLVKALGGFMSGIGKLMVITAILNLIYTATHLINPLILTRGINIFAEGLSVSTITFLGLTLTLENGIIVLASVFAVLSLLGFFLSSLSTRFLSRANAQMVNKIRVDLYHKLIFSEMNYLKNEQSGNITARITSDTDQITTGIQLFITVFIQLLTLVGTLVLVIIRTNWLVIVICLASVPIALTVSAILSHFGRRIVISIRRTFGIVSGKMAESLSGIAISKAFNREESLSKQMYALNHQNYRMSQRFGLMMNITMPFISALASITTACILWAGGLFAMPAGDIFLAVTLSGQFLRPVTMLSMMFPELQTSLGAVDRVLDVIDAAPAIKDTQDAEEMTDEYSVDFENIWFAYNGEEWVLKDVTFQVEEGELVALVGHTGAGKTTLASMLLPRFYDIQKGTMRIGGKNIKNVKQSSLREVIGIIPQEPYLFTATVLENIKYGKPEATKEEIYNICQLLGADAFIEALPEGYDTLVREGGKQLSAGQRQMITIARTMLADPKILILDEATSRLDAYSESLVQDAQRKLFKNRTTFVIAHRLSTIHDAEKIVVLDHGDLVEIGSHEELMKKRGVYADVYNTYYSFQGLQAIDLEAIDYEEEVQLSPMAMIEIGQVDKERINKLMAEGKITPEMMVKLKEMKDREGSAKSSDERSK